MKRKVISYETNDHDLRIQLECGHGFWTNDNLNNLRQDTREGRALTKAINNRNPTLNCEDCDRIIGKTPAQLRNQNSNFGHTAYEDIPNVPGWHWKGTRALYFTSPSENKKSDLKRLKHQEATARYRRRNQANLPPGSQN